METAIKRNYLKDRGLIGIIGDLSTQEERDRVYVAVFCRRFNARLAEVGCTFENGRHELMYYFKNDIGGYTIEGIICSLM